MGSWPGGRLALWGLPEALFRAGRCPTRPSSEMLWGWWIVPEARGPQGGGWAVLSGQFLSIQGQLSPADRTVTCAQPGGWKIVGHVFGVNGGGGRPVGDGAGFCWSHPGEEGGPGPQPQGPACLWAVAAAHTLAWGGTSKHRTFVLMGLVVAGRDVEPACPRAFRWCLCPNLGPRQPLPRLMDPRADSQSQGYAGSQRSPDWTSPSWPHSASGKRPVALNQVRGGRGAP